MTSSARRSRVSVGILGAALLALLVGVAWIGLRSTDGSALPVARTLEPESTHHDRRRALAEPAPEPETPRAEIKYVAKAVDESDVALPDVRVSVQPALETLPQATGRSGPLGEGTTDHAGAATLALRGVAPGQLLLWTFERADLARLSLQSRDTDVVARMVRGCQITGRVYDAATGSGTAGVRLVVVPLGSNRPAGSATSDGSGTFAITSLAPGAYRIDVRSPHHVEYQVEPVVLRAGDVARRELSLVAGIRVDGRVLDRATGMPVTRGIVVVAPSPRERKEAPIDGNGRFALGGLSAVPLFFEVHAAGVDPSPVQAAVPPTYDQANWTQLRDAELRVSSVPALTGIVVDPAGRPVAGARVAAGIGNLLGNVHRQDRFDGWIPVRLYAEALTGSDGRFSLSLRSANRILVVHPAFAPYYHDLPRGDSMEVQLQPAVTCEVRVTGPDRAPVVGAEVRTTIFDGRDEALHLPGGDIVGTHSPPVSTDDAGRALVRGLGPGAWRVSASLRDRDLWGSVEIQIPADARSASAAVELSPAPEIRGVVCDVDGRPIEGVDVALVQEQNLNRTVTTAADGTFVFPCATPLFVLPGEDPYKLVVSGHGDLWIDGGAPIVAEPNRVTRVCVTPLRVSSREIRVTEAATGSPIAFGQWKVSFDNPSHAGSRAAWDGTFVAGAGSVRVPEGRDYSVSAQAPGYRLASVPVTRDVGAGPVELQLERDAALGAIRLHLPDELPIEVHVFDARSRLEVARGTVSASTGNLLRTTYSGVALVMVYAANGYLSRPMECALTKAEVHDLTPDLRAGGGSFKLTGPAGAVLSVEDPSGLRRTIVLDGGGRWWSRQLAAGAYSVSTKDGETVPVSVRDGVVTEVDVPR